MSHLDEDPKYTYGRIAEGVHVAGYVMGRCWPRLESLLEDDRWESLGFKGPNEFLADLRGLFDGVNWVPEDRRKVAKGIKRLTNGRASQRRIAGVLGVDQATVSRDLNPPTDAHTSPTSDTPASNKAFQPPTDAHASRTPELSGAEVAKLARKRVERKRRDKEAEERRIQDARARAEALPVTPTVDLRHGDFREVLADVTAVDAILTDPPYGKEHLHLLADLAELADRVLKPDGVLAVLFGQHHLPDVYRLLDGGRPYRWTACLLTSGPGYVSHASKVQCGWKPVLIYGGGPRFADVVQSEGTDMAAKSHHRWGQDFAAFETLVERLTEPSQTIMDPFAGSGTTLLAAHVLGRHAIGCDIDEAAITTARERLA